MRCYLRDAQPHYLTDLITLASDSKTREFIHISVIFQHLRKANQMADYTNIMAYYV